MIIDLDEISDEARRSDNMGMLLNVFNNLVKQALREKKYEQIGRFPKFFLAADRIPIPQFKLYAWPGYELTTKATVQGIFLNVESCTKFVNQTSVLELYKS